MTEELTHAIATLTCRFCNGEGRTAHFVNHPPIHSNVRPCPNCNGSGIAPGVTFQKDHT